MDIIQGLIETGNAGKPGWRIVNNGGAIGVFNNRTSNVLFSILNDGGIGTSSNISSTFINSYSGINVSNYTGTGVVSSGGTGGTGGTGGSSQWTTSGSKIYYNNGNIGIGTIDPIAPLHIYNTSNTRLLLDATTTGTATVEFRRGTGVDALNDYRFINDSNISNGSLKLQCENSTQSFGNTVADLVWFSSNETIIHKNTTMNGRVGIGTVYHATRTLDVVGDANVSGVLSVAGSLNVTSNATLTNSITSNTSFTIHNGLLPPLPNVISVVPLASEIVVTGTTSGIIGGDRVIMFPYSGSAATKDYSFTTTENLICDILIVGGGGGGGYDRAGGGGAGGLLLYTNTLINSGPYSIRVGRGGVGATSYTSRATNGTQSSLSGLSGAIALGGGLGANAGGSVDDNPGAGGSGGGGAGNAGWTANIGGLGTSGQGNNGGSLSSGFNACGGGGAGGVGGNGVSGTNPANSGNGGVGLDMSSYFGTGVGQSGWFAGGGGGALNYDSFVSSANSTSSRGGQGGGGDAGLARGQSGSNGLSNTGGGGGGGANIPQGSGGSGGSGIVIIRYRKPPGDIINETISGIVGTADRYTIFPYTGTGTTKDYSFTTTEALSCDILVIGGGGGGGTADAGGGGAGACIVAINQSLNIGNYTIRVGSGGIGGSLNSTATVLALSTNGVNSSILNSSGVEIYRAVGGGRAGNLENFGGTITQYIGNTGGCGGGAGFWQGNSGVSGGAVSSLNIVNSITGISPSVSTTYGVYGNVGGAMQQWTNANYSTANAGGGGGIGTAGASGTSSTNRSGVGGNGLAQVTINSTQYNFKTYFAPDWDSFGVLSGGLLYIGGGGGGGGFSNSSAKVSGGLGGGGIGDNANVNSTFLDAPTNGVANTGSGGGGGSGNAGANGGAGGSGIVIVRYRKLPNEIVVAGTTSTVVGSDRCIVFPYTGSASTKDYTFTTTEALSCDILVVGGGGGGACFGGGGGAGQVLYTTSLAINSSSSLSIQVGRGGITTQPLTVAENGISTTITIGGITYTANGGGGGGGRDRSNYASFRPAGGTGGSGGGGQAPDSSPDGPGGISNKTSYTGWISNGNAGGIGTGFHYGGGGGGAGAIGGNGINLTSGGAGGVGVNLGTIFTTSVGANGWFGGGGGGVAYERVVAGGSGGTGGGGEGARWSPNVQNGVNGTDNTGGGGGSGGLTTSYTYGTGGKGGSGIVIIRYRLPNPSSSSSINFIRGTTTDTNHDYKVGNFNGEFKVISSVFASGTSNIETDYIRITTAGAITNPAGTANWNIGSDRRIKENIERASYDKCFENIKRLELNRFNYVSGFNTVNRDKTQLGFIAQEVYDIFPKSISTQGYYSDAISIPDLLSIDISQINYSLYGAVKKLIEINNEKDNRLKELDDELKMIETILNITPEAVATSNVTSKVSNLVLEEMTSNVTSNLVLEDTTSNITVDS